MSYILLLNMRFVISVARSLSVQTKQDMNSVGSWELYWFLNNHCQLKSMYENQVERFMYKIMF